jgi:hypothetical protein
LLRKIVEKLKIKVLKGSTQRGLLLKGSLFWYIWSQLTIKLGASLLKIILVILDYAGCSTNVEHLKVITVNKD